MRAFTTMLRLDVHEGFRATVWWRAAALGFGLFLLAAFALSMAGADMSPATWADYLAYAFMGSADTPAGRFRMPVAWLGLVMVALFLVLWYPYRDLMGPGQRLLVLGGSRWAWWGAKVVWVIACATVFWLVLAAGALGLCLATGGEVSTVIDQAPGVAANLEPSMLSPVPGNGAVFIAGTLVALIALALLQLTVSLVASPVAGFGVSVSLLVCAVFFNAPWFVPVYLMGARCDPVIIDGLNPLVGIGVSLAVGAVSILVGGLRFSTMNILSKER